jgi:hypothetical protein
MQLPLRAVQYAYVTQSQPCIDEASRACRFVRDSLQSVSITASFWGGDNGLMKYFSAEMQKPEEIPPAQFIQYNQAIRRTL